jgi:hypothetical protein
VSLLLQDAIVTAMALGAVGLVFRRIFGVFSPPPSAPPCTSCASCPAPKAPADPNQAVPLTLIGRKSL